MTGRFLGALLVAMVGLAGAVQAQDRPSENDMFAAPASEPAPVPVPATVPATATATTTTTTSVGDSATS